MRKAVFILMLIIPAKTFCQDTTSYSAGKPITIHKLAEISDSLDAVKSIWRISTVEDLKKMQLASVGRVLNNRLGFQGVFWVSPVIKGNDAMQGDFIDAKYVFINNSTFKEFLPIETTTASVLLFRR